MSRDEIQLEASALLASESFAGKEPKHVRAILRAALNEGSVAVHRLSDADIKAVLTPGKAFQVSALAKKLGCTPKRLVAIAVENGCTKVSKGVYQAPSA